MKYSYLYCILKQFRVIKIKMIQRAGREDFQFDSCKYKEHDKYTRNTYKRNRFFVKFE